MSHKSMLGVMTIMAAGSMAGSGISMPGTAPYIELPDVPVLTGIDIPDPKKKKKPYGTRKLSKKQRRNQS